MDIKESVMLIQDAMFLDADLKASFDKLASLDMQTTADLSFRVMKTGITLGSVVSSAKLEDATSEGFIAGVLTSVCIAATAFGIHHFYTKKMNREVCKQVMKQGQ